MAKKLSKEQKRKRRKDQKARSSRRALAASRRSMIDMLTRLELMDTFRQFPERIQDKLLRARNPSPKIVIAEDSEQDLELALFRTGMESMLQTMPVQLPNWPFEIPLYEYCRNAVPLIVFYSGAKMASSGKADQPAFLEAGKHLLDDYVKMLVAGMNALDEVCGMLSLMTTRFDRKIITWDLCEDGTSFPKRPLTVSFRAANPRVRHIVDDGKPRRAYQACLPLGEHEILWHEWEASVLGLSSGERLPVYVQSHAIDRLCSRLETRSELEFALFALLKSVESPRVVKRPFDVTWLEARTPLGRKVGYFLVKSVDGVALVKTFLFLTMEGTPESERLYSMLGARRDDIEYLELDKLATFLRPDVVNDKELAKIFGDCGCGQLLDIHDEAYSDEPDRGDAKDIKRYLCARDALRPPKSPQGVRASDFRLGSSMMRIDDLE